MARATRGEISALQTWFADTLADGCPFSFTLEGRHAELFRVESSPTTGSVGEGVIKYTCREGIDVQLSFRTFRGFPAVEWVLALSNKQGADSPLIENLNALQVEFQGKRPVLHWALGSSASRSDFAPRHQIIEPGSKFELAPKGGRSSDTTAFPFFNLDLGGHGVVVGIGWSGMWKAMVSRHGESVTIGAGMHTIRLRLRPGETIRTPKILLLFWHGGDWIRGNNLLRSFILAHHTPQRDEEPILGPLACNGGSKMFDEANLATEENQLDLARSYKAAGIDTEYWWIDAGWFDGRWPNGVGNWSIRKDGFPRGLGPLSDALSELGMGLILWFEPERVYQGTRLDREHPDWIIALPDSPNRLLDLGNPEARKWLTDYVSEMIEREGIAIYRQDFNMDPMPYWRSRDEPDRIGITEIRHVEGLYAFWDELLERHPDLIIDNCASGGRRIDLETISRSIPLWRTDYQYYEPNGYQCHTYGLSLFLPISGTASGQPDIYSFRSSMNAAIVLGWNPKDPDFPAETARRLVSEYKRLRPLFHGDFYPLTPYSTKDDVWMAYQFHREDLGEGMVLAFRRPESEVGEMVLRLRGLDPEKAYEVVYEDLGAGQTAEGSDLLAGLKVRIDTQPGSSLVTYRQKS